jgi:hypothetical protein
LWDFGKIVIPIPKYRPNSASNLPIPARGGVKKRYTTLIWQHTHTVTTTEVSPDLGELAEILDDVNVEMIPLRYH